MNTSKLWIAGAMAGLFALSTSYTALAQTEAPKDWFHLDYGLSGMPGVGTQKAYDLLKGRTGKKVVVAVIDSGVDINHEDLKDVIWVNAGEIPNNQIDDDKNGYVDDVHGWNFIGGKDGSHVNEDTYELTRVYAKLAPIYDNKDPKSFKGKAKKEYEYFQKIKEEFVAKRSEAVQEYEGIKFIMNAVANIQKAAAEQNISPLTAENLDKIKLSNEDATSLPILKSVMKSLEVKELGDMTADLQDALDHYKTGVEYSYNVDFNTRLVVGDDYANSYEKGYGNNDVVGPDPTHGTHVAGIIAAKRGNGIGMDGIADQVEIMVLRVVPNGDERDKDVANAIIYAADNGAKIINMSFGKGYSWDKEAVDKAVKYAESKGVLLIHAAGNESINVDIEPRFPTKRYQKGVAKNWIDVGAMSWKKAPDAAATFTNYGKKTVDLFAPGVAIYSTMPNNEYKNQNGTSMAAPVTAGVAAVIMSYFPELSAAQVKDVMMKTTLKFPDMTTKLPGESTVIKFTDLSISGGVVNLYNSVNYLLNAK